MKQVWPPASSSTPSWLSSVLRNWYSETNDAIMAWCLYNGSTDFRSRQEQFETPAEMALLMVWWVIMEFLGLGMQPCDCLYAVEPFYDWSSYSHSLCMWSLMQNTPVVTVQLYCMHKLKFDGLWIRYNHHREEQWERQNVWCAKQPRFCVELLSLV